MDDSNRAIAQGMGPPEGLAGLPAKAIAFDVDLASLASLRLALPGWEIEMIRGATPASLVYPWAPGKVGLLVVGVRNVSDSLGLCRFLAYCIASSRDSRPQAAQTPASARLDASLLVLMPADQRDFVTAMLTAGAHSCLMLPIHAKDVATMLVRAQQGNQPGRHTLNLERAQKEDPWRDNGGQG